MNYSQDERQAATLWLKATAEAARVKDLSLGLEFHPRTLTDSTASAMELMAALEDFGVRLYWQPAPGLPLNAAIAQIDRVGPFVHHVHVFEWDRDGTRHPLGRGTDYWTACLEALPEGRWKSQRYAMLEFVACNNAAALLADARTLVDDILFGSSRPYQF